MVQQVIKLSVIVVLLIGLPLLGVFLAGKPLQLYLEFPPVTRYVEHAPFSWGVFLGLFLFVGLAIMCALTTSRSPHRPRGLYLRQVRPWPWWGWLGLIIVAIAWTLAWTRFSWFEPIQPHTFTPLWVGYIVVVNAISLTRTRRCLMLNRTGWFLSLFPLSALFWWFFEYLNRFVQNWYYVGVNTFSPTEYVLHATVSFSTVLPAVLSTIECLESVPKLDGTFRHLRPVSIQHEPLVGWAMLLFAGVGLLSIGVWPDYLFPLLWVSPLLVITSVQVIGGERTLFSVVKQGDWRPVWFPALAGLVCGVFWEMWNFHSLAHWVYSVPYVHRFPIFEMPLIGYSGYLPFGIECIVVAGLLPCEKSGVGVVS